MGNFCQIDKQEIIKRYKPIDKHTHKGLQGHALIIGGSYGKMGSVVLASKACIRSGAGLVTAYIPKCGYDIVQISVPEVMVITDDYLEHIILINFDLNLKSIGIGIGMGQHPDTQHAFFNFLKMNKLPLVIDADALNILSQNIEWLSLLPKKTILTPHQKELEQLIGKWSSEDEKLEMVKRLCLEYDLIFVLKGAPTIIVDNKFTYENTTGNQALARVCRLIGLCKMPR